MLFGQQVCVVPKIGTFTLQHIPARYNPADRTLTPPRQLITFSPLWDDDGTCLRWISQKENLLDYAAEIKLNKGLEEITTPLSEGKTVTLEGIGYLSQDAHGHIAFIPSTLPGNMDTLSVQPQTEYVAPVVIVPETEVFLDDAEIREQEENEILIETDNAGADTWDTEPERRNRWWWIAIPVVLIAALTAGGIWWYTNQAAPAAEVVAPPKPAVDTVPTVVPAVDTTIAVAQDTIMYKIVFQTWDRKDSAKAYHRYAELKAAFNSVIIYPSSDSTSYLLALPSPQVDTAANKDVMKSYKRGNVYVEH